MEILVVLKNEPLIGCVFLSLVGAGSGRTFGNV